MPGDRHLNDNVGSNHPTPGRLSRSLSQDTARTRTYPTIHPPKMTPRHSQTLRGSSDRPRSLPKDGRLNRFLYLGIYRLRRSRDGLPPPLPTTGPLSTSPPAGGYERPGLPPVHGLPDHLPGDLHQCHLRGDGYLTASLPMMAQHLPRTYRGPTLSGQGDLHRLAHLI